MWTHSTGVVRSNPTCFVIKTPSARKAKGNYLRTHFARKKLRALSLVSDMLEIEYAMQSRSAYSPVSFFYCLSVEWTTVEMLDTLPMNQYSFIQLHRANISEGLGPMHLLYQDYYEAFLRSRSDVIRNFPLPQFITQGLTIFCKNPF